MMIPQGTPGTAVRRVDVQNALASLHALGIEDETRARLAETADAFDGSLTQVLARTGCNIAAVTSSREARADIGRALLTEMTWRTEEPHVLRQLGAGLDALGRGPGFDWFCQQTTFQAVLDSPETCRIPLPALQSHVEVPNGAPTVEAARHNRAVLDTLERRVTDGLAQLEVSGAAVMETRRVAEQSELSSRRASLSTFLCGMAQWGMGVVGVAGTLAMLVTPSLPAAAIMAVGWAGSAAGYVFGPGCRITEAAAALSSRVADTAARTAALQQTMLKDELRALQLDWQIAEKHAKPIADRVREDGVMRFVEAAQQPLVAGAVQHEERHVVVNGVRIPRRLGT